ncbi:PAS domain-containing sensor histidine kinase [Bosea sp. Root381]|uniref:sensor histidine kinase n=1 Tax=Bosea sp. Root381 TaxID=1736524 RepID=UPI0006F9F58A|nr:PAS domain-containing sensor histidine kinase [Bosea sp. Root381]KRE09332.1 PAS domain-containing sensor histidine kinase [Bosea sp. Root381]
MKRSSRQERSSGGWRRHALLPGLAASQVPAAALAQQGAALAQQSEWLGPLPPGLFSTSALSIILAGLTVFATTTSLVYVRERTRWQRREAELASELEAARGQQDRLSALLAADPQVIVSWNGRKAEPVFEGDSGFLGAPGATLALAYGAWATPADAKRLELATDALKERGEAFGFTLRSKAGPFIDVEGRPVAGRAVVRFREVTGERAQVLALRGELERVSGDYAALAGLLAGLPQPAWTRTQEGRLSWCNGAYARAVEAADGAEAVTKGLELLDRGEREGAAKARREGRPFSARAPAVVAGQRRTLDVLELATPAGFAGIATDMSELEAVRADLQRQMDAHVRTLDRLKTAVAVFDASQRLVYHNAGFETLWSLDTAFLDGLPSDSEILDRLRTERRLPELGDYRSWKAGVQAAYTSTRANEDWWYLPDGRTVHVVASPNPQGGVTYLFDDVTERFTLESRFNALSRTQRETLDSLREGVAVFGSDGRLKLSNPAFSQSWKIPADLAATAPHIEEVVRLCRPLFPQDEIWSELHSVVTGVRDAREDYGCRMERRDGTVLDCAAAPLPDGATLITFADVTAGVNVERALTEKNEALEKVSRLREDFVHHVSYELRSPLTNIIGFAQLLGTETIGALNEKQRDYTSHIVRSSGALLAIINDILDLATIDNGALTLELENVDVAETIAQAAAGLYDRLAGGKLDLKVEIAPQTGRLRADGRRLRQVLFNLISNAIGFSSPGQSITVSATRSGSDIRITVADQGRGIPAEVKEKVFDRFESHSLGSSHRGVGLGLSIVRSIVELHGGRVELDSAPGRGTRVTALFPAEGVPMSDAAE